MDLATHIESTVEGFPVSRNLGTNISRDRKINIEKKKIHNFTFIVSIIWIFQNSISKFFNIFVKILL